MSVCVSCPPGAFQAVRALMIVGVVLGIIGAVISVFSLTCLTMNSMADTTKAKMSLTAGIMFIISGMVTNNQNMILSTSLIVKQLHLLTVSLWSKYITGFMSISLYSLRSVWHRRIFHLRQSDCGHFQDVHKLWRRIWKQHGRDGRGNGRGNGRRNTQVRHKYAFFFSYSPYYFDAGL